MSKLHYQSGFANEFASEAVAGALPKGRTHPRSRLSGSTPNSSAVPPLPLHGPPTAVHGSIAFVPR